MFTEDVVEAEVPVTFTVVVVLVLLALAVANIRRGDAGRRMLRNKKTARAEQLAQALSEGFTPGDLMTLMAAAKLIERLGEAI